MIITGLGGLPKDLISIRCSFFNLETSYKVSSSNKLTS